MRGLYSLLIRATVPNLPLAQPVPLLTNQPPFHQFRASQDFFYVPGSALLVLIPDAPLAHLRADPRGATPYTHLPPLGTLLPSFLSMCTETLIVLHHTDTKKRSFPT